MKVTKITNIHNTTKCVSRRPQYIVWHYTAGTSSNQGKAKAIAEMFAKTNNAASADYIVDDGSVVQYNPDVKKRYCWSVGGTKYISMTTSAGGKYYGKCTNANSISVELCSSKKNTKTLNASDTDWYFTNETIQNALWLAKKLSKKYPDAIHIMHHHVTGKVCPNPWTVNEKALNGWEEFKLNMTTPFKVKTTKEGVKERSRAGKKYFVISKLKKGKKCIIDEVRIVDNIKYGRRKKYKTWIKLKNIKQIK